MNKSHCLNCNEVVSKNFCPNCGQKTDSHRITLKHFIFHDILHGVWHFEKGILFTLKEAIVRPGQAALDYIGGKRVRYYNVFYLSLLVLGLNILLLHYYKEVNGLSGQESTVSVTRFFTENVKIILFSIIPLLGLNAWLIFRQMKLNIAEHFIIGGMCLLGMMQFAVLFSFFNFLTERFSLAFTGIIETLCFAVIFFFPIWSYYNAIKYTYTVWGRIWRLAVFYLLVVTEITTILVLIILNLTEGKGDFFINI